METWSYETRWTALLRHIHFCSSVFYRQPARVHDIASEAMSARSNIFWDSWHCHKKRLLHEKNRNVWPGQLVPLRLKFFRQVELSSCTATTLTQRHHVLWCRISQLAMPRNTVDVENLSNGNLATWKDETHFLQESDGYWQKNPYHLVSCESYCLSCLFFMWLAFKISFSLRSDQPWMPRLRQISDELLPRRNASQPVLVES